MTNGKALADVLDEHNLIEVVGSLDQRGPLQAGSDGEGSYCSRKPDSRDRIPSAFAAWFGAEYEAHLYNIWAGEVSDGSGITVVAL